MQRTVPFPTIGMTAVGLVIVPHVSTNACADSGISFFGCIAVDSRIRRVLDGMV